MCPVLRISVGNAVGLKHLPNPSPACACFEFLLAPHCLTAGWKLFHVNESPRAGVALRVKGRAIFRIIVLLESRRKTARLSDIDLTPEI